MDRVTDSGGGDGEGDGEGHSVADVQLFQEDVVRSLAKPGVIGMVVRVGGDSSDSDSSDSEGEEDDDDDDDDDDDGHGVVEEGCARIVWIDNRETVEKVTDIQVVDRAFMHGDVAALASDPLGQTGTVIDVDMLVDLKLPGKEIVRDVDSRLLRRVRGLTPGDNVVHGHWLGRVEEVLDNVTVVFDDGSKCKVQHAEPGRLVPIREIVMDGTESVYYPGQRVRATSSGVFKNAKWLSGSWKASRMEGTVLNVEAGVVSIYWIAVSALHTSTTVPSDEQDPKNLVPMTFLSHTNWQIGDRALLPEGFKIPVAESEGRSGATSEAGVLDMRDGEPSQSEGPSESAGENAAGPTSSANAAVDELEDGAADGVATPKRKISKVRKMTRAERKAMRKDKTVEKAALVVNTRTFVDVFWQDGTRSSNVNSCSLVPVEHLGDHDFWPEQYVLEQVPDGGDLDNVERRAGILKSVDSKQRTAVVRWLVPVSRPEELRKFGEEEIVSVYELIGHPDYVYCLGDVVIRLSPAPSDDLQGELSEASSVGEREQTLKSITGKKKTRNGSAKTLDLSWVGIIIGLHDGDIEVQWANGMISKVGPQAIFVVTRDEDDMLSAHTSDLEGEDDGEDAVSWTTVDSDEQRDNELDDGSEQFNEEDDERRDTRPAQGPLDEDPESRDAPRFRGPIAAAIGLVSRMANGLFGLEGNNRDGARNRSSQGCARTKHGLEEILGDDNSGSSGRDSRYVVDRLRKRDTAKRCPGIPTNETDERIVSNEQKDESRVAAEDEVDGRTSSSERVHSDFGSGLENISITQQSKSQEGTTVDKESHVDSRTESALDTRVLTFANCMHFDIVSDPSDHHYFAETAQADTRRWTKKIQSEWSILEKNLPDTIYVRVYEERMDLLRAVILGAPGTPYHDGFFVFDLYLPPEYPNTPPVAYYHSGGLRLNPNLYENGKVCLSLLNTWSGRGTEVWDPQKSSILQVLVSIQGLVLNTKPYFNEAGFDRQIGTLEGEKNSVVYNENSFLLSCKSMLYLIRRPPMHCEELIRQNFLLKGAGLLRSCEAYLQGAPVGSLVEKDTSTLAENELVGGDKCSAGFKLMLTKLLVKLKEAFKELGVEC